MKRFAAWLWKEWRDQRAITIGILIAIPGLTALAYWAFGERIGQANLDNVRSIFLGIAVGLVVFAVAGDLFAGESRRQTIRVIRRLPGSMRSAFLAKLTLLALLILVAVALQGLSLAAAEHLNAPRMAKAHVSDYYNGSVYHADGTTRSAVLLQELAHFPGSTFWLMGLGFGVLALWTLLVSSWMGRSGVAGIGSIALLAALATPFALFFKQNPWFFPGPMQLAAWTAGIAALVALAATSVSFLRGQRFHGRPFRPFLLGASVLLVCLGGGYVYAQQSLQNWLEISPTDEDFRIYGANVGAGGDHLFLTVYRGEAWGGDRFLTGARGGQGGGVRRRGTPLQGWVVDLESGGFESVDARAQRYFDRVPEEMGVLFPQALDPVEALVAYQLDSVEGVTLGWWDARLGKQVRLLPSKVRDATTLALVRRQLQADSWQTDSQGRRVWIRDGLREHEGERFDVPKAIVARPVRTRALYAVPGGWFGHRLSESRTFGANIFVDEATGQERDVRKNPDVQSLRYMNVVSPTHMFVDWSKHIRGRGGKRRTKSLLKALGDSETLLEPKNPPAERGMIIGRDRVLALRGAKHARTLHVWNPITGADSQLHWQGRALEGISTVAVRGRTADGRILLRIESHRPDTRYAWALIDAAGKNVTSFANYPGSRHQIPVAVMPDDSLILLVDQRRVVRYRLVRYRDRDGATREGATMKVLFPRPR